MKCHYEILEIAKTAEDNEIKTAYRKLALKWHPDKNIDNTEYAKEQFQLVQQAYEVLSDRQERAWYDNHREQILRGSDSNFEDNSLDVFPYFTTQCFKGYGDDENGFYTVYRKVFEQIAKEDIEYMDSKSDYDEIPNFGNSLSDYEEIVGPFYAYWMSYTTKKSYVWLDPYNINETRERRVLKLIEKENKKVRQKAKKERNEEVRNLVAFVRKRDRRVQAYAKFLEAKNIENRQKQEQLRKRKLMERKEEMSDSKAQAEWSNFNNVELELKEIEKSLAAQFGENLTDSEEESLEDCEDLYCVACNKVFKNPKAFANHESSKKHRENVEILQISMKIEDESLELENNQDTVKELDEDLENLSPEELTSQSSKKKTKKNKKVIKILDHNSEDEKEINTKQSDDDFDFGSSKRQKKKSKSKPTQEKTNEEALNNKTIDKTSNKNKIKDKTIDIESIDVSHCCVTCKSIFNSKNKLFEHLKKTGHSVILPQTQKTTKSKKKLLK